MIAKLLPAMAGLLIATGAQALTYTAVNGAPDPGFAPGETAFVTFDTPLASTGFTLTGGNIAQGTSGAAATPAGDTSKYFYVSPSLGSNNATLTTPFDLKTIGFYWGSIDKYNSVDVLGMRNGVATTLYTLGGGALPPSNGDQFAASTNRRVTFVAGSGEAITGLKFTSTNIAFELDTIGGKALPNGTDAAVPEPASWALFVVGFGLVGAATRRRKTTATVAA